MKKTPLILSALLFAFIAPAISSAQTKESPAAPPTGTYAPAIRLTPNPLDPTNNVPLFSLRLETNGTYVAKSGERFPTQDGDILRLRPQIARGTWRWDSAKREFQLDPGDFVFYIKRLPVDQQRTNRLVWRKDWLVREDEK